MSQVFHTILAIGAVQGVVLAILLWRNPGPRKGAYRWLAVMMGLMAYRLFSHIFWGLNWIGVDSPWYYFFLDYNWAYGPLLYFFVWTYEAPGFAWKRRYLWHFLPLGLQVLGSNFIKAQNFFWDGSRESLSAAGYYGYILWKHTPFVEWIAFALVGGYALRSLRLLAQRPEAPRWLDRTLRAFLCLALALPVFSLIDFLFFDYAFHPFSTFPIYLSLAVLLYALGLVALLHREDPLPSPPPAASQRKKWATILATADQFMQTEAPFRDSSFDLPKLAEAIGYPAHQLSQALNQERGLRVQDYLNQYRVAAFEQLISEHPQHTLLALAFEAGFNSKAAFNRAVKKHRGQPPSALRKEILQKEGDHFPK